MLSLSRRIPSALLALSFLLILTQPLIVPVADAQDGGAEVKSLLPAAIQWGLGGVMFTVWLYQFRKSKQSDETVLKLFTEHLAEANKITSTAFTKYDKHIETLMQVQRDSQDRNELLVGTLARLEVKLATPVMCPLLERRQSLRSEGG